MTNETEQNSNSSITRITYYCIAAIVLLALYGRIMGFTIRRDEMIFVSPAGFIDTLSLYRDVFYNQVPYSAYLFGLIANVTPFGLLEGARLSVFVAWLALLSITWLFVVRLSGSTLVALASVVMLVTNETLLSQVGSAATNNFLPFPFAAAAIGMFLLSVFERDTPKLRMILIGVCLGIACGLKVSAIAFVVPIAIACCFVRGDLLMGARIRQVVAPVLFGGLLAGAPILYLFAADPALFLAHVVSYHTGPHLAYYQELATVGGLDGAAMGVREKIMLAMSVWLQGSSLLLVALAASFAVAKVIRSGWSVLFSNPALWISLALLAGTILMSFVPTPAFLQYYAPPLVVLPFVLAILARGLFEADEASLQPFVIASVILMGVLGMMRLGPSAVSALHIESTTPAIVERGGAALAGVISGSAYPANPVATLMPLYPLEASLPVYPELATGQFLYRVAHVTEQDLAAHYVMAGPRDIAALFDNTPPSAILVGFETSLEAPFIKWAEENGYVPISIPELNNRYGEGVAWIKPIQTSRVIRSN